MDVANRILAVGFCLATLLAAREAGAVNAVEALPLPCPQRCLTDVAAPVAFDETTNVAVACPDAAAVPWLAKHFKEWYGVHAPKVGADPFSLKIVKRSASVCVGWL